MRRGRSSSRLLLDEAEAAECAGARSDRLSLRVLESRSESPSQVARASSSSPVARWPARPSYLSNALSCFCSATSQPTLAPILAHRPAPDAPFSPAARPAEVALPNPAPELRARVQSPRPNGTPSRLQMIRKSPPPSGPGASSALTKRSRIEDDDDMANTMTVAIGSTGSGKPDSGALIRTIKRTSGLEAPIVALTGAHGVRFALAAACGCCVRLLMDCPPSADLLRLHSLHCRLRCCRHASRPTAT